MKFRFLLLSGSRQHPQSIKMGYLFLGLVALALSIYYFTSGNMEHGFILLTSGGFIISGNTILFSQSVYILPFLEVKQDALLLKKSIFHKEISVPAHTIDSICITKNTLAIEFTNNRLFKGELSEEITSGIRMAIQISKMNDLLTPIPTRIS